MFLSGVIEGFYGPPWSQAERATLFEQMAAWGLDTYLYCPKDDLHHRAVWREPYGEADGRRHGRRSSRRAMRTACASCTASGPAWTSGTAARRIGSHLRDRCAQMLDIGCDGLALLFDDIPDRIEPADLARWGSLAGAQADVANDVVQLGTHSPARSRRRRSARRHTAAAWSRRVTAAPATSRRSARHSTRRSRSSGRARRSCPARSRWRTFVTSPRGCGASPILWDNLHANDYDGRRILLGPYSGRPLALRDEVRGILTNPNTEFALNFMAFRTLAMYLQAHDTWQEREAYLAALREWLPSFETMTGAVPFDDLVLLADCYYLPYREGPEAEALLSSAHRALADRSPEWRAHATTLHRAGHSTA